MGLVSTKALFYEFLEPYVTILRFTLLPRIKVTQWENLRKPKYIDRLILTTEAKMP